eukprot:3542718-Rhodomonas_salina.4
MPSDALYENPSQSAAALHFCLHSLTLATCIFPGAAASAPEMLVYRTPSSRQLHASCTSHPSLPTMLASVSLPNFNFNLRAWWAKPQSIRVVLGGRTLHMRKGKVQARMTLHTGMTGSQQARTACPTSSASRNPLCEHPFLERGQRTERHQAATDAGQPQHQGPEVRYKVVCKEEPWGKRTAGVSQQRLLRPSTVRDSPHLRPLLFCHEHAGPQQIQKVLDGCVLVCEPRVS